MTALEEFDAWMKRYQDNYLNNFSILINNTPDFVFVDSPWPGHGDVGTLSIVLFCVNGLELFSLLNISGTDDLDNVQPEDLLQLYYDGEAIVLCTTKNEETLKFQKAGDTLVAIIDGQDLGHEVKEQLLLPGDFFRYTEAYFQFMKEYKEKGLQNED